MSIIKHNQKETKWKKNTKILIIILLILIEPLKIVPDTAKNMKNEAYHVAYS